MVFKNVKTFEFEDVSHIYKIVAFFNKMITDHQKYIPLFETVENLSI